MVVFLTAQGSFVFFGLLSVLLQHKPLWANRIGATGAVLGSMAGLASAIRCLDWTDCEFNASWLVPGGAFHLAITPLSAWFLLPLFVLGGLAAVYGAEYLLPKHGGHANESKIGAAWFFYNMLLSSMALVFTAQNAVLFLVAWEVMALTSFFLVTYDDEKKDVREAGWTYLVATHVGTAFLFAFFALMGRHAGSFEFSAFAEHAATARVGLLFVLAVIGFGTKAGFMPLHVWLPEAHPAAPSHVSALMSGVMIKTGIYGMLLTISWLGKPAVWWGWLLIGIGLVSGVHGILFALTKRDLKKMLAYSSVENMGIITMALGLFCLGLHAGHSVVTLVALAAVLLHVVNHSLMKGLLFLNAGAIQHATGTRNLESMGGLYKKMPGTGLLFLLGVAAIAGLPPLNGFIGEFFLLCAALVGVCPENGVWAHSTFSLCAMCVIGGIGLIGGLAVACFTKAFGMIFLGEARTDVVQKAHDPGWGMLFPMMTLAGLCIVSGLCIPVVVLVFRTRVAEYLASFLKGMPSPADNHWNFMQRLEWPMPLQIFLMAFFLFFAVMTLVALRRLLLKNRPVEKTETWGCGYVKSSPRIQYTAFGYSQMLMDFFGPVLRTRLRIPRFAAFFPKAEKFTSETSDVFRAYVFAPLFKGGARLADKLRWLQHGNIHLYIFYIALTLFALLLWKLRGIL